MSRYTMVDIDAGKTLTHVEPQPFFRGDLLFAEDCRREYLLISQSMSGIAAALDECCGQTISETSLYESARRQLRRGRTGGCWNIVRLRRDEAIAHYNGWRSKYAHRVVATRRPSAWKFE